MSHEPIHSGHFMTSNPHTDIQADEDEDVEVEVVDDDIDRIPVEDDSQESDALKDRDEKPVTFYKFGPKKTQSIAIDVSLNKLNKCIKVAYNKMTTPKWKDFKGLRLHWKQRIRLNNVIWRAYYMEFRKPNRIKEKKVPYCYFAVPDEDQTHQKIEGSVLEGMYWKRRMEAVCAQYKRWRYFNRPGRKLANAQRRKRDNSCSCDADGNMIYVPQPPKSQTPKNLTSDQFDLDDFENVFTDTLFESLNQPYMFPNPKEMAQTGNADIMQPGLLSLQPSLEEIMASLDAPFCMGQDSMGMAATSGDSSSGPNYSAKEYDTAAMLVNYSNQPRPPSHSAGLLASTLPPLYSQASYGRQTSGGFMPDVGEPSGAGDYLPQFATLGQGHVGMQQQKPTAWIGPPQQQTWSSGMEDARFPTKPSTPSKGALKAFPVAEATEKKSVRRTGKRRASESKAAVYGKVDERRLAPQQQPSVIHHPTPQQMSPSATLVQSPQDPMMHSPGQPQLAWPFLNAAVSSSGGFSPQRLLLVGQPNANTRNAFVSMPQPLYPQVAAQLAMSPPSVHSIGSAFNLNIKQEPSRLPIAPYSSSVYTPLSSPSNSVRSPSEPSTSDGRGGRGQPPTNSAKRAAADSTIHPVERKRILHLHAEQSRRTALKDGFDQLMELLPNLYSGGTKPTNAVVLAKGGEYIRDLCNRKEEQENELQTVKDEIQRLNNKISALQTSLPTANKSGPSTALQEQGALQQYFDRYVKERSREDWRFWLMARMMLPLFETFKQEVKGDSTEEMAQSAREWAQNNCQLVKMRPSTSNTLIYLATNTSVMTDPKSLENFALQELKRP
uniref:BHLH domain-containing protein n=1 Tax=Plectus sambesii TaxID=2011161 RepID=A0A914WG38_9BILA